MKKLQDNVFGVVLGTHVGTVLLLIIIPALQTCSRPKPKDPAVFVEIISDAPAPVAEPQPKIIEPVLAEPEPEPTPAPTPAPKPKPIPKPVAKPKPKPKPKPAPVKPKWKPAKVIRQNNRTTRTTSTPKPQPVVRQQPNLSSLKGAIASAITDENTYHNTISSHYYSAWRQPASSLIGQTIGAEIRVEKSGRVSATRLTRSSGNSALDQSVQLALNAAPNLPAPPTSLAGTWIGITFVVD